MASPTYLRLTKSETRELGDREHRARSVARPVEWQMSDSAFFTAFVVISALVASAVLILR